MTAMTLNLASKHPSPQAPHRRTAPVPASIFPRALTLNSRFIGFIEPSDVRRTATTAVVAAESRPTA